MSKYLRKLRLIAKGTLSSIAFRIVHRKGFDPKTSILVFGSIRSGSTWLAEVLSSLDGHVQIFEPLHPEFVPDARKTLVERNPYVPSVDSWPAGRSCLFGKILSGKLVNSWTMSQASIQEVFHANRLVIKFVRGNLLLEWLAANMDIHTPVLVIRHPCAIIASHLNKGWPPSKNVLLGNSYFDRFPEIRNDCSELSEPEELAALAWCLRYHAPLMSQKPYPFILVSYEKLVRNGKEELEKLFRALDIPLDKKAIDQLSIPSDTVTKGSQVVAGRDPLAGWRGKLNDRQVDNILAVLNKFGMDFYSTALEPDYVRLSEFGSRPANDRQ